MRLLLALVASTLAGQSGPGLVWDEAPPLVPGGLLHQPTGTLDAAALAWRRGDRALAEREAEAWRDGGGPPFGGRRAAGSFLLGWIYRTQGRWNLASGEFTRAARGSAALAEWAAWYEAEADLRRGRSDVALRECAAYRVAFPEGRFAGACLLLEAEAALQLGRKGTALEAVKAWEEANPDSDRGEVLEVLRARAEAITSPRTAAARLQWIALSHRTPGVGQLAREALAPLVAAGVEVPEVDPLEVRMRTAVTLRESGELAAAWTAFLTLSTHHADDPEVAAWLAREWERFHWRTRRYPELVAQLDAAYRDQPTADRAWTAFRAAFRGGLWESAARYGAIGLDTWGTSGEWRTAHRQVAFALQYAGEYRRARDLWDAMAERGSSADRREARLYGGWCSLRAGDLADAETRLTSLVDDAAAGDVQAAARYHRARARFGLKKASAGRADLQAVVGADRDGWYGVLARQRLDPPTAGRDGHWHAPPREPPRPPPAPQVVLGPDFVDPRRGPSRAALRSPTPVAIAWADLAWPHPAAPSPAAGPLPVVTVSGQPLRHDDPSPWYDPVTARSTLEALQTVGKAWWPELEAASHFAAVGLTDLSGPLVAAAYDDWDAAQNGRTTDAAAKRSTRLSRQQWREATLYAGDYHHGTTLTWGLHKYAETPEATASARRHTWPLAWRPQVWLGAELAGLDPLLVLSIMRQESVYRPLAVSSAGARGPMQVMPRTGWRVAARLEEVTAGPDGFHPDRLFEPEVGVRYGAWYLGQLDRRFGGCWALAVAGYNAGPINASSFVSAWRDDDGAVRGIELDDLVEHIPLDETRTYVKRVTAHYAGYTALYDAPGTELLLVAPSVDHTDGIDF